MKRTFNQFKISNRLDSARPETLSAIADPELTAFSESMTALDQRLRDSRAAATEPPPWLRASIMNEVRQNAVESGVRPVARRLRPVWIWAAVCAVTMVVAWGVFRPARSGPETALSASHADADAVVRMAARQSAGALTGPFDAEMQNLSQDLSRATEFLLASLP